MLRNREITILLIAMCTISLALIMIAVYFSYTAALFVFITSILLIGCSFIFTRWRYKEIEKLSSYLRQITSGNYSLDVRDNQEGELSILKNEMYKVTLMLSEQKGVLKQDKIMLTNAISDISHQLKTPLTSMMMMADLLKDAKLPMIKRMEFTNSILQQLERMEWLVSSLLKLSKIDAGTIAFKQEKVSVKRLIEKALETVLIPMDIKEQTLTIEGEEKATFVGDQNWTCEALINILKNCVEHTQTGGSLSISFSENVLYTEILIADNGEGVAKEDLPYIFNRFYKGKNAGEDSVGIGLAMAHSIIKSQNGDIHVQSKQKKGTQFQLKFYKQII
ncbi:signal transduction histidine kinase [Cytobacillus eiseniae]|uniref:histidine kinase n=1 Tax=Cytobacillus eiseniae TaxID=762947 RepID=A0ABS4RB62_9BACI|nr:HAMP domain-containing sensor histidine kinase [Cytobacillus eiseniae]MBP2239580.1 signal transduction histidine kinase [Cytobacillus eiseniae]